MQVEPRSIQIFRVYGIVPPSQKNANSLSMLFVDTRRLTGFEEFLKTTTPEVLDHARIVTCNVSGYNVVPRFVVTKVG